MANVQEVKNTTYLCVVLGLHLESQIIRRRRAVASGVGNSFFADGFANKCFLSWRMVILWILYGGSAVC